MGNDLRQRIVDSVKITWKTINDFALAHRATPNELTDQEVDSAISQIAKEHDPDETACKFTVQSEVCSPLRSSFAW